MKKWKITYIDPNLYLVDCVVEAFDVAQAISKASFRSSHIISIALIPTEVA